MNIAFIGLGNMGLPMAKNLVKAGYQVTGFDLDTTTLDELVAIGGKSADSIIKAVANAQCIITMLPASRHVEDVYLAEHGIIPNAPKTALLIDCSTIAPEVARRVANIAQDHGFSMLDAPVSGGTNGAEAATLTFMVGGQIEVLDRARPLLEKMGKNIFHAGASGSGQTVKVCNNMLLGILMIGSCEALRLGLANGLDPKILSEIMAKSSGRNWVLEVYNPCPGVMENVPSSRNYTGGFGVDLMQKDLGLAVENALSMKSSVPLGALACNLYALHSKAGNGQLDFSSIFNLLGKVS